MDDCYQQPHDETSHLPLEEQQMRDMWWEDFANLRQLAEYLADDGWSLAEFAAVLSSPWKFTDYWEHMQSLINQAREEDPDMWEEAPPW